MDRERSSDYREDDLPALAPPEGIDLHRAETAAARRALFGALSRGTRERKPRVQFSLAEMGALATCAAVVFSAAHYLPLPAFAGLIGAVGVGAMYLETWIPPRFRWLHWAAWGLIVTYIATAAAALLRS